jgi:PAS domain S-box-containing protein
MQRTSRPEFNSSDPLELQDPEIYRTIFRAVNAGICIADATARDMPVLYVNPAFEAMTGHTHEEMVGKNCRILQCPDTDPAVVATLRSAIQERREVVAVLLNHRKDGTQFWNELFLSPVRNRAGKVTHFLGIQNDVTERVEFEIALRESEKLAAVGRLAASIAHEINNPLEAVMNLIYLAQRTECSPETQQYLGTADQELQRVKSITAQSLRFFKQSTRPQTTSCAELLTPVLALYQSRLDNAGIAVERRKRSTHTLICMESEIRQVLNNLVGNAIDAMQRGGRLLVRSREATDWRTGRPGLAITIADTGSGIASKMLGSIYKAFYTTKGIGGTGLGLWISRGIVERHNGRLLVRSSQRPGHTGTVFQLFLPSSEPAAA